MNGRLDWRTSTPTELLDGKLVLTLTEVAYCLGLTFTKGKHRGEPSIQQALALIDSGRLRPVDPSQAPGRLTVSVAAVQAYIDGAPAPVLTLVKESA